MLTMLRITFDFNTSKFNRKMFAFDVYILSCHLLLSFFRKSIPMNTEEPVEKTAYLFRDYPNVAIRSWFNIARQLYFIILPLTYIIICSCSRRCGSPNCHYNRIIADFALENKSAISIGDNGKAPAQYNRQYLFHNKQIEEQ